MNAPTLAEARTILAKPRLDEPAIVLRGSAIAILAGTTFRQMRFMADTEVAPPSGGFSIGADYVVAIGGDATPVLRRVATRDDCRTYDVFGGLHFAPGGNAPARSGGDETPAINPFSIWDLLFRPACPDPRGMALVYGPRAPFWGDIYLTAADHLAGTSRWGVEIADGESPPERADGGRWVGFNYDTAVAVLAHHGKQLMAIDEFFAAAYGVTERTSASRDPVRTGLDAARTSKFGLMQASGNMLQWATDGDPDDPRPYFVAGSWQFGRDAGSRYAHVDHWLVHSDDYLGARGRSDHLQPA